MPKFILKDSGDEVTAEQWFPGKYVEGVTETAHDPGDGTTQSSGFGYLNTAEPDEPWCVRPGDWIVTYDNGIKTLIIESIFYEDFSPVLT